MRKYAILVDGSNLYSTLKAIGLTFDYNKLLTYFDGELVRAYYLTAEPADRSAPWFLRPLVDHLQYNGYCMVTKPMKEYFNEDTRQTKVKGNMDIEIAIKAIEVAPFVSDIVLVTGDGDFVALVQHLQTKYGIKVTCMSTRTAKDDRDRTISMVSDDLRRECDVFIDLNDPKVRSRLERNARFEIMGR